MSHRDDPFEQVYDPATIDAIDERALGGERPRRTASPTANAALVTALVTGVKDLTDPDPDEGVVEVERADEVGPPAFVTVTLVPGAPRLSRATVRPWLAPI